MTAELQAKIDTLEAEVARLSSDNTRLRMRLLADEFNANIPTEATPLSAQEDVVERAGDVIEAFYQKRRNIGYSSHEIAVALSDAGLLSTDRERG